MTAAASNESKAGPQPALPPGPLVAYYGDDFTGSTDVLDAWTAAGLPTVLFVEPPQAHQLDRYAPGARCIGLAGTARGRGPPWMDAHLGAAFAGLVALGAPLLHYKVCSTFDSSPQVGSIGRAIDLGVAHAPQARWSPVIVGAPRLRRYQAFGHLFAAAGDGQVYRLDRHPTMSRHPVTPMPEADLRRHLALQTARRIELIDFTQLRAGLGAERLAALQGDDVPIVLLDVLDDETLAAAGDLVWAHRGTASAAGAGLFSASSSGLEYALAAYWRRAGWIEPVVEPRPGPGPAAARRPLVAVSGSCSPVTAAQIEAALAGGTYAGVRVRVDAALTARAAETERLVGEARRALHGGRQPLIYSAAGPADLAVAAFDAHAREAGLARDEAAERLGHLLGQTLAALLDLEPDVGRVLVAGGDSAGAVVGALDITALTVARPMSPGAPLVRAHSANPRRDGLELVLKGGQMGAPGFFDEAAAA